LGDVSRVMSTLVGLPFSSTVTVRMTVPLILRCRAIAGGSGFTIFVGEGGLSTCEISTKSPSLVFGSAASAAFFAASSRMRAS
jgi:hypothetical protein